MLQVSSPEHLLLQLVFHHCMTNNPLLPLCTDHFHGNPLKFACPDPTNLHSSSRKATLPVHPTHIKCRPQTPVGSCCSLPWAATPDFTSPRCLPHVHFPPSAWLCLALTPHPRVTSTIRKDSAIPRVTCGHLSCTAPSVAASASGQPRGLVGSGKANNPARHRRAVRDCLVLPVSHLQVSEAATFWR